MMDVRMIEGIPGVYWDNCNKCIMNPDPIFTLGKVKSQSGVAEL
jgi:hypothetical protein